MRLNWSHVNSLTADENFSHLLFYESTKINVNVEYYYFIGPMRLTSDWTVVCLLFDIIILNVEMGSFHYFNVDL